MSPTEKGHGESGGGEVFTYRLVCDCGMEVRGDLEVEILSNARNHIDEAHPEFVSRTDAEILSNAERVPPA